LSRSPRDTFPAAFHVGSPSRPPVRPAVRLAVTEHSAPAPDRPTVVLVHGYPDDQRMWDPVAGRLVAEGLHVVTYDVRGAGRSQAPPDGGRDHDFAGYRTERLLDDLAAVLDAVLPAGRRVHLVGHDWGAIALWDAVAAASPAADRSPHPGLRGRVAGFTAVSGASLDHAAWLLAHPRGRRLRLLGQLLHSWYVVAFAVPGVAERAWRHGHRVLGRALARRERLGRGHWGDGLGRDAAHGVGLYRANVARRLRSDAARRDGLRTDLPVLALRPVRDDYLTAVLSEDLERGCRDVRVVELDAAHWVPRTHPGLVAGHVLGHVRRCEAGADAS
jgi:pimeloyl-ACP methyl ester carboxylesterase